MKDAQSRFLLPQHQTTVSKYIRFGFYCRAHISGQSAAHTTNQFFGGRGSVKQNKTKQNCNCFSYAVLTWGIPTGKRPLASEGLLDGWLSHLPPPSEALGPGFVYKIPWIGNGMVAVRERDSALGRPRFWLPKSHSFLIHLDQQNPATSQYLNR